MPIMKPKGHYTEYIIMYTNNDETTTRLFFVTAGSVEDAIKQFRLSHTVETILSAEIL